MTMYWQAHVPHDNPENVEKIDDITSRAIADGIVLTQHDSLLETE